MKKILSNYAYQAIYQIVRILMLTITIPIVAKSLNPNGVGIYNYTYSITSYFIMFSALGVSLYGSKEIAIVRNDREKLSLVFWEIFTLKVLLTLVNILAFCFLAYFMDDSYYLYIQSFSILSVMFDITWLFIGVEDFKYIMLSSFASQVIIFGLIIKLIQSPEDLGKYIFIQSMSFLIPQLFPWFQLKKYVSYYKVTIVQSMKHLKGMLALFIPQISIIVYTTLNKTLLGIFDGMKNVGYYSSSLTMNQLFITLITSFDTVMLPRMSNLYANKKNNMLDLLKEILNGQLYVSIPLMFGMMTVNQKFVPWFLGTDYLFVTKLIPLVSVLIVVIPLGSTIAKQYLIPIGNVKIYNYSVFWGAVISLIINGLFLNKFGIYATVMATILTESFVSFSRLTNLRVTTGFTLDYYKIGSYLVAGFLMYLMTTRLTEQLDASLLTNCIQVGIAVPIYLLITTLVKTNPLLRFFKKTGEV